MAYSKKAVKEPKKATLKETAKTLATKTEAGIKAAVEKKVTKPEPVKKPAEKTSDQKCKTNVVLEYGDKSVSYDALIQNAKNKFQYDMGGDPDKIKNLDLYVKPSDGKVYFVIDEATGDFDL